LWIKNKVLILPSDLRLNPAGRAVSRQIKLKHQIMAQKVYKVIVFVGRKRNVIFESKAFDPTDGHSDWAAFKEAAQARKQYWGEGRVEISLYTKKS